MTEYLATAPTFVSCRRWGRGRFQLGLAFTGTLVADHAAPAGFRDATVLLGPKAFAADQWTNARLLLLYRVKSTERGNFHLEFAFPRLLNSSIARID